MAKSPNWTSEEISILREQYPIHGTHAEIQKYLPDRTLKGISVKAVRLGLKVLSPWNKVITTAEYRKKLPENIEVLEEYILSNIPLLHICRICETTWRAKPNNIVGNNSGCPSCAKHIRAKSNTLSTEEVDTVLENSGILRLEEYIHSKTKMLVRHISCGHEWKVMYNNIQAGVGCPLCNKGFGYGHSRDNLPAKAFIYLFSITTESEKYLKVGVTTKDIRHRQYSLRSDIPKIQNIELLHICEDSGVSVLMKEKKILDIFINYHTKESFGGSTELLDINNNTDNIKKIMNENI